MKRVLSLTLCVLLLSVLLMGCSPKTVLSAADFQTKMEKKGFTVQDVTATTPGIGKSVMIAYNTSFQVEYFELSSQSDAKGVFENNKTIVSNQVSSKSTTSTTASNYDTFTLTGDGQFFMLTRVDNTVLYCLTSSDNKDEVKEIFEYLGY